MNLEPDAALGATEVFVSADRFYPAGFRVEIGAGLVMELAPGRKQLDIVKSTGESDFVQARSIAWDGEKLHLVIGKWVEPTPRLSMKIVPLPDSKPSTSSR